MTDLVIQAEAQTARLERLPAATVTPTRVVRLSETGEIETLTHQDAAVKLSATPHLLVAQNIAARRLNLPALNAYDLMELFAFVRPARFCLPTLAGLCEALTMKAPEADPEQSALQLHDVAARLLADLGSDLYHFRAGAARVADFMARAGWTWGPLVAGALMARDDHSREDGLRVWTAIPDWEDDGPKRRPGDEAVDQDAAEERLLAMLGNYAEVRPGQRRYARAATYAFRPREQAGMPNLQILEAGTGTGKTMGYIAPASLWAERNDAPVWLSTYTKNLQRQLDQELARLYPDPKKRAKRAVIRKGRENYACLLNVEETLRAVEIRSDVQKSEDRDRILMGLVVRWA